MSRSASRIFLGFVLVLLIGLCPEGFPNVPVRSFRLTYEVSLPAIPNEAGELKIWVPLSRSDEVQRIRRRVIQVPYAYRLTKDPQYGNEILFLDLKRPLPPALDLAIHYDAEVREVRPAMERAEPFIPDEVRRRLALHLESNQLMVVDDGIRELARSVTAHAGTPAEKARAIFQYVIERMRYEKETPGWGQGDTLRACAVGAGNCTDFHSLFISLARASGIPARFAIGLPVPQKPEGEIPGYHCWAEFYLQGAGWVPVDASEAWKDPQRTDYFFGTYDPNRLTVSLGRDVQLEPKPASSDFINIFFFPYVELDGMPLEKGQFQTRFRFRDLNNKGGVDA